MKSELLEFLLEQREALKSVTHNTGYVWIDQLDNTFAVETEDAVSSRFNLTNHDKYLGCALNVEFNGKYLHYRYLEQCEKERNLTDAEKADKRNIEILKKW